MVESTAFGAAGLAGIASGAWKSGEEFRSVKKYAKFSPAMSREHAAAARAGWKRAIDTALFWAKHPKRSQEH